MVDRLTPEDVKRHMTRRPSGPKRPQQQLQPATARRRYPHLDGHVDDEGWFDDEEEEVWTQRKRAAAAAAQKNLDGVTRIMAALQRLDEARAALDPAANQLLWQVHSVETPQHIKQDFERFLKAGGVTRRDYGNWLNGDYRKAAVPQRKHLRLVSSQKHQPVALAEQRRQQVKKVSWSPHQARRRPLADDDDPPDAA